MLNIELDNEGFLVSSNQWNRSVANDLASLEGIKLNDEHWEIIDLLQDFYEKTDTVPETVSYTHLTLPTILLV